MSSAVKDSWIPGQTFGLPGMTGMRSLQSDFVSQACGARRFEVVNILEGHRDVEGFFGDKEKR
jgi:hypothetical protein